MLAVFVTGSHTHAKPTIWGITGDGVALGEVLCLALVNELGVALGVALVRGSSLFKMMRFLLAFTTNSARIVCCKCIVLLSASLAVLIVQSLVWSLVPSPARSVNNDSLSSYLQPTVPESKLKRVFRKWQCSFESRKV